MSLFGAMSTAISGLSAQSAAFSNISDNVANSQTVGYKRVDTSFIDYLTTSSATTNDSGAVVTRPDYVNTVQGTITQSDNPLSLAIAGQGFFAVSEQNGTSNGLPTFNPQQYYTRAGDFQMNKNGYLVNSAGQYLNGWAVDPSSGQADRNLLQPIQVSQQIYNPVATSEITLSANLPATPTPGAPISSQVNVYDALGTLHTVTLNWTQTSPNNWQVSIDAPDDTSGTGGVLGTADVTFGTDPAPQGTVGSVAGGTGTVTTSGAYNAGQPATLSFTADFGSGAQAIQLNLGTYGQSTGLTQYAGTDYSLRGLVQNGVAPGAFSSISTTQTGDVVVNYDNGQSRTIARIPIVTFNNPNALQRQDGEAFTATQASGTPTASDSGSNGAGSLVTNAVESSNVDIASEFSKLIVAQRAYSANTKMVTTADDMLQQTIDMKR